MPSSALSWPTLAEFSAGAALLLAALYVILRRAIDGAPVIDIPVTVEDAIEDADLDELTEPGLPAFVESVPTPVPEAEEDIEHDPLVCSTCRSYQSRLTSDEGRCWFCSGPLGARKAS